MTETCSELAHHLDEPLAGTAPTAIGWLLVEQPGPWGRNALTASGLDPVVGAALAERASEGPVRTQVVRRPGTIARIQGRDDVGRNGRDRIVMLAHTGPRPWAEALTVRSDEELAAIDPQLCALPEAPGVGRPMDGPIVLVCTHGRRDRCCASFGRPIADTLAALHPDLVWESSHVGGHRFAGNVVLLPHGLVYGGLDVARALETLTLHLAGRIDVGHLRGRSGLDRIEQAAEVHVRAALGLDHLDEVRVLDLAPGAAGSTGTERTFTVGLEAAGRRVVAQLELRPLGAPRRLSCDSTEEDDPDSVHLVSLDDARAASRP